MYRDRRLVGTTLFAALVFAFNVTTVQAQDGNNEAKARAKVKKDIRDALAGFKRTISTEQCSACKGTGKIVGRRSLGGGGFNPVTGPLEQTTCSACSGSGRITVLAKNRKAVRELAERYGIAAVVTVPPHGAPGEYPLETALCAQHSLERYLDLLDLIREHAELVEKDKELGSAVENARKQARIVFGRDPSLFEALGYQIAKSKKDVKGAGVCLTAVVEQLVTINQAQYARIEWAAHSWLVRVPDGVRWTEKATVRVIGRVVGDVDYETILGSNRAATIVEPSIDSQ